MLTPGDTVLAVQGLTVKDVVVYGDELEILPSTCGKKQPFQREVEQSQQLVRVHAHIERIIGLIKNKYIILKGQLPTITHPPSQDSSCVHASLHAYSLIPRPYPLARKRVW